MDENEPEDIYIVFDGPPGPEGPRFVETENARGEGVSIRPGTWMCRDDGYWVLGPLRRVDQLDSDT
jgi:hypothetical protein